MSSSKRRWARAAESALAIAALPFLFWGQAAAATHSFPVVPELMAIEASEPPVVPEAVLDSVFLVGVAHPDGSFTEVGTAWTIAPNWLATNAHVAEGLQEALGENGRMVARRGVLDQNECALGNIQIHPAYTTWNQRLSRMLVGTSSELKGFDVIAVADVAVIEVIAGDSGKPLTCSNVADPSHEPRLGGSIMYVGYPAENLSGFATAHVVCGNITAKTDFFFMRTDWADSLLLHFAGPATGGASGSPVLDAEGRVIGILSAAEHLSLDDQTRISFGFTYAQRIDLALELLNGTVTQNQARRNGQWLARATELFVKPEAIVAKLISLHAEYLGVDAAGYSVVTQRQDTMPVENPERSIRVVLDPGYEYGFLAVAHDGSDVDIHVRDSAGTTLGEDIATDQYPVVWLGPYEQRTELFMVVQGGEPLIQPTPVSARVVRIDGATIAAAAATAADTAEASDLVRIKTETVTANANGAATWFWTITADPGTRYVCNASSPDMIDIDMRILQNDTVLAEDVLLDWYPRVEVSGYSGELRLELLLPEGTEIGDTFEVTIDTGPAGGGSGLQPTFDDDLTRIKTETVTATANGGATWFWTITADPGTTYICNASSPDMHDIDLRILQDGVVIVEDVLMDWYPRVEIGGRSGELRLELILPEGVVIGDTFEVTIDTKPTEQ